MRNTHLKIKEKIVEIYSNGTCSCICCDEKTIQFMTLDHINNDGFKEKKKGGKGSGIRFYEYLYANNFPRKDELQILCMNCNFGKSKNSGICPHKKNNILAEEEMVSKKTQPIKDKIIEIYSNGTCSCACCGEKTKQFLSLDHIYNDGYLERKETGRSGVEFYKHLKSNNFPRKDELQILCMNCNFGKRMNSGICPNKNHNMPMVIGNGPIP